MLTKDHKIIVHPADPFPALRRSMRQAVKGRKEVIAMQQKTPQLARTRLLAYFTHLRSQAQLARRMPKQPSPYIYKQCKPEEMEAGRQPKSIMHVPNGRSARWAAFACIYTSAPCAACLADTFQWQLKFRT